MKPYRQKQLFIHSQYEENVLAKALDRHVIALERYPTQETLEEIAVLASFMRQLGYRPATEQERRA